MTNHLTKMLNLKRGEEDKQKTLRNVKLNIYFMGSNLWILACAIIVASVGLNVNSTAVIIGAMLISPLMGPIIGSGFALGTYDFDLLKKSLINLLLATVVSLVVSSVYFYLSPFKEVQSELLARTSPNIYDVIIAFFGGLVGVIAITRVEKGNPIAGVAIATALMPPLCTAGYSLATSNFHYFFGALYLYTINCVFICISTFVIVKYLKYPHKVDINEKHRRQVRYIIVSIILAMILPSTYFAFSLFKAQEFKQRAENFINAEFIDKGNTIVYKKTEYAGNAGKIELAFLNNSYSQDEVKTFNDDLKKYGITNAKLIIKQNSLDNINAFRNDILNEVSKKTQELNEKDRKIQNLEAEKLENTFDNQQMFEEISSLLPISSFSVAKHQMARKDTMLNQIVCVYKAKHSLNHSEKVKLKNWLQKRLSTNDLVTIEE